MKIRASDHLLVRFADAAAPMLRWLGQLESNYLREELAAIAVKKPVFITGLARAGTTILLELLSQSPDVATHRYRDFPFLTIPYLWNKYLDLSRIEQPSVERAHRDRIEVTAESPEAFEEPIWQMFFPHVHDPNRCHLLGINDRQSRFDSFYGSHLKKVMFVRGGGRYVSKGNYNLTRIEYLLDLFPDAKFIVPVRHPTTHVDSLVRMHRMFSEYARADRRVPRYLAAAGHYEFGPQRVPIRISESGGDAILAAWSDGHECLGYARQWAEVYRHIDQLQSRQAANAESILIVRYEDFCEAPDVEHRRVRKHAGIDTGTGDELLAHIAKSPHGVGGLGADELAAIWEETASVAQQFGYEADAS